MVLVVVMVPMLVMLSTAKCNPTGGCNSNTTTTTIIIIGSITALASDGAKPHCTLISKQHLLVLLLTF